MKIMKGILVDHSKKVNPDAETRFYKTTLDDVAVDDVFSVWAHGRLTYFKVKTVLDTFECLPAENCGTALEDVSIALNKVDFKAYNVTKAALAKTKRIKACIAERIAEGKAKKELDDLIKATTGDEKESIKALMAQLKALSDNPESALED